MNRLRRFLYGLLLAAAAPGAAAADELAYIGKFRAHPVVASATAESERATVQGLVLIAEEPGTMASARLGLDSVTARLQEDGAGEAILFAVHVHEYGAIRDGVGFDIAVPSFGNFHLNLYTRRNARTEGKRWAVGDPADEPRTWSVGGSLELVRTADGEKQLAFVPELIVDLSSRQARYLPFQAAVKFANWRSVSEKVATEEKVPQLMFKWRL